jgi:hypothetical protein
LEYLGLHNKPKAVVHLGHKLTGPKEEEEEEEEGGGGGGEEEQQQYCICWNEVPYRTLHSTRLANES